MKNLKQILLYNKLLLLIGAFLLIYVIFLTKIVAYKSKYDILVSEIIGKVTSIKLDGNKLTLGLFAKENIIAIYYLKSEEEKNEIFNIIHFGDKVLLKGSLNEPLASTIPNTFDYKNYLYNKKIYYTFSVTNYEVLENCNFLYKIKDMLFKKIYSMDNSDYFLAFILGDKTLLSSDIFNSYQTNGISHLLAISGMHINMLVLMISYAIKNKRKEFIITSLFLMLYLFFTGLSASILRSILFYILMKINCFGNFRFSNMHILIFSAFIILFVDPFMIFDLGFIYSFVVCFGIIYYSDYLKGSKIIKLLKLSFITFLFSLPITALVNYEVNVSSIFINLIFVPWVSLFLYPFTLITFILPLLNPLLSFFINITNSLNIFLCKFSLIVNIPKMPIILVVLYYIILLFKDKKMFIYLCLIIILCKIIPCLDGNYYVYYLDVGQGDSALLISPYKRETILIDTGGKVEYNTEKWQQRVKTYNLSDNTIKFLKSIGITTLTYMIITHGDADHAKESLNIIDKIRIKNVVLNNDDYNNLEKSVVSTNVNITNNYNLKYFKITNLNNSLYDNENDNSLVSYITFLDYKLLFMGDASVDVESDILSKYNLRDIDIFKVGHHGSKYSSSKAFIDAINPRISIISVGRNNRYGHPHKEVLDNLNTRVIFRTDKNGTISFKLNKNGCQVKTYSP